MGCLTSQALKRYMFNSLNLLPIYILPQTAKWPVKRLLRINGLNTANAIVKENSEPDLGSRLTNQRSIPPADTILLVPHFAPVPHPLKVLVPGTLFRPNISSSIIVRPVHHTDVHRSSVARLLSLSLSLFYALHLLLRYKTRVTWEILLSNGSTLRVRELTVHL